MTALKTWGDLLARGQGLPQSAPVVVSVGGVKVAAELLGTIGGVWIEATPPAVAAHADEIAPKSPAGKKR